MMRNYSRGAIIAVCLVALMIIGMVYGVWTGVNTLLSPPDTTQQASVTLVIQRGESTQAIADDLYQKGLIRNTLAFRVWARVKGLDTRLRAGAYLLTPGMGVDQIVARLQTGRPDEKRLTVVEGWRIEQISAHAQTLGLPNFSAQDFLNYTHHPNRFPDRAHYPLLQQASNMEGLLFPDTYLVPINYNTIQVIELMLNRFNQIAQENNLVARASQHRISEYQMVILASIVQREAANDKQMPLIAGIYWKRLYQPSPEVGTLLEADPTVQYARDTDHPPSSAGDYWKPLTDVGGRVDPDNPWNTYNAHHPGLPPTPIASPGLIALQSAASPMQTDCYYFLSDPKDGALVCASTYEKFQQLEKQYLS